MDNDKFLSENLNKVSCKSPPNLPKKRKGKEITSEITVNFKFDDYEPVANKYQPAFKKQSGKIYYDNVDILDQNRFKFILNMIDMDGGGKLNNDNGKGNYSKYSYQINSNLKWEDITAVIYYSVDNYTCPICLEKKLICPKITRCGHIFCWPCLQNYYNYWVYNSTNKKIPKCPLCQEKINLSQIKFCEILHCIEYVSSLDSNSGVIEKDKSLLHHSTSPILSNFISFNLIMKNKNAPTLYNTGCDPDLEYYKKHLNQSDAFNFIPYENQEEFSFSRIFLTTPQLTLKRYNKMKTQLEETLNEELNFYSDERRIASINECIEIISKKIKSLKDKSKDVEEIYEEEINNEKDMSSIKNISNTNQEGSNSENINENFSTIDDELLKYDNTVLNLSNFLYFYQEQYGDIYYLHPINYSILIYEYGNEENLPTDISEKILEINMYQTTPFLKNKYPFLNHLRIGSIFFFVEIDMKSLVGNHTLKQFYNILKERSKVRNSIKREEENYDNYIQNIKIKEDRKLSSEYIHSKVKVTELFKEDPLLTNLDQEYYTDRKESVNSDNNNINNFNTLNSTTNNTTEGKRENKLKQLFENKENEKDIKEKKIIEKNMQKFIYNEEDFPDIEREKDTIATAIDEVNYYSGFLKNKEDLDEGFSVVKGKKDSSLTNKTTNKKKKKFAEVSVEIFQQILNNQNNINDEDENEDKPNKKKDSKRKISGNSSQAKKPALNNKKNK